MDIPVAVLLSVALIWLVSQEWSFSGPYVPRGIPTVSAVILVVIIGVDWFFGHRSILGNPGGFFHTVFKLVLGFLLVPIVSSGLTAIFWARNITAALLNIAWSAGLVAIVLMLMGAWGGGFLALTGFWNPTSPPRSTLGDHLIPTTWLEWVVLAAAGLWALLTNIAVRNHYKGSTTPQIPANTFAMIQLLSVVGVLGLHRSPFHLLWLFPVSYIAGFFTLRSRILAFLPWVYGYILAYTIPSNWFVSEPKSE
jgi:hypothetical protein